MESLHIPSIAESATARTWRAEARVPRADALLLALDDFERACEPYAETSSPTAARALARSLHQLDLAAELALGRDSALPAELRARLAEHYRECLLPYVRATTVTRRTLDKPRGYAGDFLTIELMYRDEPRAGGTLGELIDRCILDLDPPRAVRNRRKLLCEELTRSALERAGAPLRVTSLACGPARELFDFVALHGVDAVDATLVDIDAEALAFVREHAEPCGFRPRLVQGNLIKLALRGTGHVAADQDLIYSVGLIDYLSDELVIALLDWIHAQLRPGGRVIVGNFHPRNPSRVFMDEVLDWRLIYRTEADLNRLFAASRFGRPATEQRFEPAGVNLFATCVRE